MAILDTNDAVHRKFNQKFIFIHHKTSKGSDFIVSTPSTVKKYFSNQKI